MVNTRQVIDIVTLKIGDVVSGPVFPEPVKVLAIKEIGSHMLKIG
jgi:hypothetical protein